MVMPANNAKLEVGYLAGKYPGRVGHLYTPASFPKQPYGAWLPYALDNGRFAAWKQAQENGGDWSNWWDTDQFIGMCSHYAKCRQRPLWVVCPDVVGDRDATIEEWKAWEPLLKQFNIPLAFAVQDGMTEADVPKGADLVFVGGSTVWKWLNYDRWPKAGFRTHVGRVNGYSYLRDCHKAGIESVDGTGFFRGDQKQLHGLREYLKDAERDDFGKGQMRMFERMDYLPSNENVA
jgi:hypothetical protein